MKANLMRVNPKLTVVRDQSLRLLTAGVAGPALLWAGYKYPGTPAARAALVALGAALIYTNFGAFQATREPDVASE